MLILPCMPPKADLNTSSAVFLVINLERNTEAIESDY